MKIASRIIEQLTWKDIKIDKGLFKNVKKPTGSMGFFEVIEFDGFKISINWDRYQVAGKWGKGSKTKYSLKYQIEKNNQSYKPPMGAISNKTDLMNSIKKAIFRFNRDGVFK